MEDKFSTIEFHNAFYYDGDDLGSSYGKAATIFRVWAPTAADVSVHLYEEGLGDNRIATIPMDKAEKGTWIIKVDGDLHGVYYTYLVTVNGRVNEAVDPYVRTTGVNGLRGMVIDLERTNPDGFREHKRPDFHTMTDAILYELHIRDLSIDKSSAIKNAGKFLGLTERGTKNDGGLATGLDHIIDLGITHLHLLPSFDYATVDESRLEENNFNWGYDPENYNVPEGSYSTDPYHGEVRVYEFKQMVQALHENGIRVVMDVVYNHTAKTVDSNFNKIVPDYYYRKDGDIFSNGSGCGNEVASERVMVRKYIVESVVYWAREYKVDGFRFDLMGLHDLETMKAIREALNQVDPSILIYGEGWIGGDSTLAEELRAMKVNIPKLKGIGAFSDDIRDGVKGSVFEATEKGFVSGRKGMEETIKFGIVGSINHPQVDYDKVNYSKAPWANVPAQTINYVSAHDNLTLWDKLLSTDPTDTMDVRIKRNKLTSAIILTSQGIPFFQAGEEMLRSKVKEDGTFDENSYQSSDFVNSIKWNRKTDTLDVYNYYKGLIQFRKEHPELRMASAEEIRNKLTFIKDLKEGVVGYMIQETDHTDKASNMIVIFNSNREALEITIPQGTWEVYINGNKAGTKVLETVMEGRVIVGGISSLVACLVKDTKHE